MIVKYEPKLEDFNEWCGATATKKRIIENGKQEEFVQLVEEMYPDGLTETELNDMLWFEAEWIYEQLGMTTEEEESEE
jgi:hypothetical protein